MIHSIQNNICYFYILQNFDVWLSVYFTWKKGVVAERQLETCSNLNVRFTLSLTKKLTSHGKYCA